MIETVDLFTITGKRKFRHLVKLNYIKGRIEFLESSFGLKDEIKAMQGSKWHGYVEGDLRKIWTVSDCQRNNFQLEYLKGNNPYAWFDRPLEHFEGYRSDLKDHQILMSDAALTYHYQVWGAEMGVGKSLSAIEVMEKSGKKHWYWVGPLKSLPNMEREFKKWGLDPSITVELIHYEKFTTLMDRWERDDIIPDGIVMDESSRVKNHASSRSRACQIMADMIREKCGMDGYVILMSGTPSPKTPLDWWSQAEIAYPGFLKEGSVKALEQRLAFLVDQELPDGMKVKKRIGWKDSELRCEECGGFIRCAESDEEMKDRKDVFYHDDSHKFIASVNEVAYMNKRLEGLVTFIHKADVMDLPDKQYRKVFLKPTPSTLRVAKALVQASDTVIKGVTLLRELSDGFQYREEECGMTHCRICRIEATDHPDMTGFPAEAEALLDSAPVAASLGYVQEWETPTGDAIQSVDMFDEELVKTFTKTWVPCPGCDGSREVVKKKRVILTVKCPKDEAFVGLLGECYEQGRIVAFGGFTGSIDRMVDICIREGWDVIRCDGRGWQVRRADKSLVLDELPLDYWSDMTHRRVTFVGHPRSGGMSLTLTEASMMVFWSNSFAPEDRIQAEDRIHRMGMDDLLGATIVDLIHLPTDERVLEIIKDNRRLEKMTMGDMDFQSGF